MIEVLSDLVSKASNHAGQPTLVNALTQYINSAIFHSGAKRAPLIAQAEAIPVSFRGLKKELVGMARWMTMLGLWVGASLVAGCGLLE